VEKRLQAKREEIKLTQTPQDKAMMRAMRIAGKVGGEIKVRDKPQHLEKLRVKTQGERLSELSKLEDDLKRQQDRDELSLSGQERLNKLTQQGTGTYKSDDPNIIDKILDGQSINKKEIETISPDKNLNAITATQMSKKFDVYKPTKIEPEIKTTLDEGRTKELLKRLHTDENGRIAITDLNLQEKILHHPDNVEVRKIGTNKVALVGKSSGHDYFRILGNFSPGTGIPLGEHFKTIHGDKYEREPMEFASSIEDQNEEKNELKDMEKREKIRKLNNQAKLRMRKIRER